MSEDVLQRLAALIHSRRGEDAAKSYTSELLQAGIERCAKKLGEEATRDDHRRARPRHGCAET